MYLHGAEETGQGTGEGELEVRAIPKPRGWGLVQREKGSTSSVTFFRRALKDLETI